MKLRKMQKALMYLLYTILAVGVTVAVGDFIVQYPAGTNLFKVDSNGDVTISGNANITTSLTVMDLVSCDTIDTDANGSFKCGSDDSGTDGIGILNNTDAVLTNLNITPGTLNVTVGSVYVTGTDSNIPLGGGNISAASIDASKFKTTVSGDGVIINGVALDFDCSDVTDSAGDHLGCSSEDITVDDDFVLNTGDTITSGGLNVSGGFNATDDVGGTIKVDGGSITVVLG